MVSESLACGESSIVLRCSQPRAEEGGGGAVKPLKAGMKHVTAQTKREHSPV